MKLLVLFLICCALAASQFVTGASKLNIKQEPHFTKSNAELIGGR